MVLLLLLQSYPFQLLFSPILEESINVVHFCLSNRVNSQIFVVSDEFTGQFIGVAEFIHIHRSTFEHIKTNKKAIVIPCLLVCFKKLGVLSLYTIDSIVVSIKIFSMVVIFIRLDVLLTFLHCKYGNRAFNRLNYSLRFLVTTFSYEANIIILGTVQ